MKVIVTGDREWSNVELVYERLAQLPSGSIVVHGACKGLDILAHAVAEQLGFIVRPYPADWTRFGNSAGPIRNQQMIDCEHRPDEPVDMCIAFHDDIGRSRGTKNMVERATVASIEVEVLKSTCASSQSARSDTIGTRSSSS